MVNCTCKVSYQPVADLAAGTLYRSVSRTDWGTARDGNEADMVVEWRDGVGGELASRGTA